MAKSNEATPPAESPATPPAAPLPTLKHLEAARRTVLNAPTSVACLKAAKAELEGEKGKALAEMDKLRLLMAAVDRALALAGLGYVQ